MRPGCDPAQIRLHEDLCVCRGIRGGRTRTRTWDPLIKSIHDLRRLYVSTSLSAGVPLDQIGQVVGHASIATTRGYAYLQTDAARLAAEMAGRQFDRLKKNPA